MSASLVGEGRIVLILIGLADVLLLSLVLALVWTLQWLRRIARGAEERNAGFVERERELIEHMRGTFEITAELEAQARRAVRVNGHP